MYKYEIVITVETKELLNSSDIQSLTKGTQRKHLRRCVWHPIKDVDVKLKEKPHDE